MNKTVAIAAAVLGLLVLKGRKSPAAPLPVIGDAEPWIPPGDIVMPPVSVPAADETPAVAAPVGVFVQQPHPDPAAMQLPNMALGSQEVLDALGQRWAANRDVDPYAHPTPEFIEKVAEDYRKNPHTVIYWYMWGTGAGLQGERAINWLRREAPWIVSTLPPLPGWASWEALFAAEAAAAEARSD